MEETGQFLLWVGIALFLALAIADTGRQQECVETLMKTTSTKTGTWMI